MKAPARWAAQFQSSRFVPQIRIGRVSLFGLGFLLASCSDNVTQSTGRAAPSESSPLRTIPDVVVMERTTTDAAEEGQVPAVHVVKEVLTATVRVAGRPMGIRAAPAPATPLQGQPRPPLSLPARQELAICSALPAWNERTKGTNGHDIVLSGVGDAPASSIKFVQADGSLWNVERSWTRTANTWQLDRQVTTGARGYKDVVTYRHENAAGKLVNNAIPTRGCAAQQPLVGLPSAAASRSFYAPYSSTLYSRLVPGAGVNADIACSDGGDACFDKRMAVYKADIAVATTAASVAIACVLPVNVLVGPCISAAVLYVGAVATLAVAKADLDHCLDEAANRPRGGNELSISSGSAATLTSSTRSSVSIGSTSGQTRLDCSGGSTGYSPSAHCHLDIWEISYDGGQTWQYFTTVTTCDNAS